MNSLPHSNFPSPPQNQQSHPPFDTPLIQSDEPTDVDAIQHLDPSYAQNELSAENLNMAQMLNNPIMGGVIE